MQGGVAGPGELGGRSGTDPVLVSVAAYTSSADTYAHEHREKWAERIDRFVAALRPGSRILDAGCGPGRDLARFVARGHLAEGVDLNPAFVAMAAAHAPVRRLDLRGLGAHYPEASFEGIWAMASLVHLSKPEARVVLGDFARLLRPAGRLYACVHGRGDTGWWDESDGRRWYTVWEPDVFAGAVEDAGLVVEDLGAGAMVEVWARAPGRRPIRRESTAESRDASMVGALGPVAGPVEVVGQEVTLLEEDVARVLEACRELREASGSYLEDDFLVNLVATVVDFQTHTTAVERALRHFRRQVRPKLDDVRDLERLFGRFTDDRAGNTKLAEHLLGYRMWTRARMLRELVAYFGTVGVRDQASLRRWATSSTFEDFRGQVKGLGPAVYQWLVMRQGVDTVKPDVHVRRLVEGAIGRPAGDGEVVALVSEAARRLGRSALDLDWVIWETGRNGPTAPEAPSRVEAPAGRVTPWPGPPRDEPTSDVVVTFLDDDAGYLAWLATHPGGFVLNSEREPRAGYLVLHRATCGSLRPRPGRAARGGWTAAFRKTCAEDQGALIAWAGEVAGAPSACGMCRPPTSPGLRRR